MKYLLVLLVVGVGIWLWSARFRKARAQRSSPPTAPSQKQSAAQQEDPARMVACAHCGVHLPVNEAVYKEDSAFCCDAHRRAGQP